MRFYTITFIALVCLLTISGAHAADAHAVPPPCHASFVELLTAYFKSLF